MTQYDRQTQLPGVTPHPRPAWKAHGPRVAYRAGQASRQTVKRVERKGVRKVDKAGGDALYGLIEMGVELAMHPLILLLMAILMVGSVSVSLVDKALDSTGGSFAFRLLAVMGLKVPWSGLLGGGDRADGSPVGLGDLGPLGQVGDVVGPYKINSGWGPRQAPKTATGYGSSFHRGLDLPLAIGTPLFAPVTGTRVECKEMGGLGLTGILDLGGLRVTASHLDTCNDGTYSAGQSWGTSGNSGNSSGPHLHYGQYGTNSNWVHPNLNPLVGLVTGSMPGGGSMVGGVDLDRLYQALVAQESSGNHQAVNLASGAGTPTGLTQIQKGHITSRNGWDEQCLGRSLTYTQFKESPELQEEITKCKLREYLQAAAQASSDPDEQIRRVAAAWYSGRMGLFDSGRAEPHGPSIRNYTLRILERYKSS